MNYQKFENENYEMLKCEKLIVVKDKRANRYYEVPNTDAFSDVCWNKYSSKVNNKVFILYVISFVAFLAVNISFSFGRSTERTFNGVYFVITSLFYTLINVVLHEVSHIIMLKMFNKKIDRIGLRINYIFPSVYVRMNDAYMLTGIEKIIVHSAGIYVNILFNSIILVLAYIFKINILFAAAQLFTFGIVMNTVPVLNSDGYKVMLAMFIYNEKKDKIYNSIFVKLVGYANILLALCYLVKLILDIFDF